MKIVLGNPIICISLSKTMTRDGVKTLDLRIFSNLIIAAICVYDRLFNWNVHCRREMLFYAVNRPVHNT